MLERFVLLALLVVSFTVLAGSVRWWARARTRQLLETAGTAHLRTLEVQPDGRPILVTFSTPSCAACHTAQAPAVATVQDELGTNRVHVVKVDAAKQPHIAHAFGVMTVPSTVVLDSTGRVTAVNHGFANSQRLVEQLQVS